MTPTPHADGRTEPTLVVGVGASAGGLQALRTFFAGFERQSRSAFVVLQHLKPDVRSYMVELLARDTALRVEPAVTGGGISAGTVYICPPGRSVTVEGSVFHVDHARELAPHYRPIDVLLTSLANTYGPRSVGVILSGSGNDGAEGVRAIAAAGGMTLAQDPHSAQFEDMPRNAVGVGCVDYVVAPDDMAELIDGANAERTDATLLARLNARLLAHTGLDMRGYKTGTLRRRIERRLAVLGLDSIEAYTHYAAGKPEELDRLASAVLIGVTEFFRDPSAWRALDEHLPALIESVPPTATLRVWCAGCSTGEEAYSLVFAIRGTMERIGTYRELRVFATDINPRAIERTSLGVFSADDLAGFSSEQRAQWFVEDGEVFRARPELRRCIVFARHDAIADPPFTQLHLAVCRNLLIYLEPSHQRTVLERLGHALRQGGLLFLGGSESADPIAGYITPLDSNARLYRKLADGPPVFTNSRHPARPVSMIRGQLPRARLDRIYQSVAEDLGVCLFALDHQDQVVYSTGPTHRVVRLRAGMTSVSIADLLLSPLDAFARRMLRSHQGAPMTVQEPRLEAVGVRAMHLRPAAPGDQVRPSILRIDLLAGPQPTPTAMPVEVEDTVAGLRDELAITQHDLQASNEQLVAANEELQATNEELIASNEELQATNEELHSVNEELHSVNAEFELKLRQLTEAKSDLDHVIDATQVGVIFLDGALRIRRFTGNAERWFRLMPQDIGRPFSYFQLPIIGDVDAALTTTLEARKPALLDSPDGNFIVRLLPFEPEHPEPGVVIVVTDATGLYSRLRFRSSAFDALPYAIALVDPEGVVAEVNDAWRAFSIDNGGPPDGFRGMSYIDTCRQAEGADEARAVAQGLADLIEGRCALFQQVYPCHSPTHQRWFLMHAARLPGGLGAVVAHLDITSVRLNGIRDE